MKVTERGQITIPKHLREKYGITPNSEIEFQEDPQGILIVKRVSTSPFRKYLGKASETGFELGTDEFLETLREGTPADGGIPGAVDEAGGSEASRAEPR
jgi:AbrB family looped-hinge helix DNA binding protein